MHFVRVHTSRSCVCVLGFVYCSTTRGPLLYVISDVYGCAFFLENKTFFYARHVCTGSEFQRRSCVCFMYIEMTSCIIKCLVEVWKKGSVRVLPVGLIYQAGCKRIYSQIIHRSIYTNNVIVKIQLVGGGNICILRFDPKFVYIYINLHEFINESLNWSASNRISVEESLRFYILMIYLNNTPV